MGKHHLWLFPTKKHCEKQPIGIVTALLHPLQQQKAQPEAEQKLHCEDIRIPGGGRQNQIQRLRQRHFLRFEIEHAEDSRDHSELRPIVREEGQVGDNKVPGAKRGSHGSTILGLPGRSRARGLQDFAEPGKGSDY